MIDTLKSYLKESNNVFRKIDFTTKAEDKCLSVACASLISRYVFIKEMEKQDGNDNEKTKNDLVKEKTTQSR